MIRRMGFLEGSKEAVRMAHADAIAERGRGV